MPKIHYDNYRTTFGSKVCQLPRPFNALPCGTTHAILAGSLAAAASLFAKLAIDARTSELASHLQTLLLHTAPHHYPQPAASPSMWVFLSEFLLAVGATAAEVLHHFTGFDVLKSDDSFAYSVRAACLVLIGLSNILMWALFSKALHKADSSITVTVYNTAVNFFLTALLGNLVFGEPLSLRWWFGSSLILLGTVLMAQGAPAPQDSPSSPIRNSNNLPPCRLPEPKKSD